MDIFRKHDLTQEQLEIGSVLSPEQIMVLENDLASIGQEVISTTVSEADPDRFRKIAHAQGQIKILQYIIARSHSITNTGD